MKERRLAHSAEQLARKHQAERNLRMLLVALVVLAIALFVAAYGNGGSQ